MASINSKVEFSTSKAETLVRGLKELGEFDREEFHKQASKTQVTRIRKRTRQAQQDVDGVLFATLAENTQNSAFPRPKPGQKELPNSVRGPNHILEADGSMLKAMTHEGNGERGRVFFADSKSEQIAIWQNEGTRGPYDIMPRNAKALRIPLVGGGGNVQDKPKRSKRLSPLKVLGEASKGVFTRKVTHPGLKPRKFFGFSDDDIKAVVKIAERMAQVTLRKLRASL